MLKVMDKYESKERQCFVTKQRVAAIVLVLLFSMLGTAGIAVVIWQRTSSHGQPAVQTTIRVVANAQDAGGSGYVRGANFVMWLF